MPLGSTSTTVNFCCSRELKWNWICFFKNVASAIPVNAFILGIKSSYPFSFSLCNEESIPIINLFNCCNCHVIAIVRRDSCDTVMSCDMCDIALMPWCGQSTAMPVPSAWTRYILSKTKLFFSARKYCTGQKVFVCEKMFLSVTILFCLRRITFCPGRRHRHYFSK